MGCTKPAVSLQARRRQQCKALLPSRSQRGRPGKHSLSTFRASPSGCGGRFTPGRLFLSRCSVPGSQIVSGFLPQRNNKQTPLVHAFFQIPETQHPAPVFLGAGCGLFQIFFTGSREPPLSAPCGQVSEAQIRANFCRKPALLMLPAGLCARRYKRPRAGAGGGSWRHRAACSGRDHPDTRRH